jgi:hypothetical protein
MTTYTIHPLPDGRRIEASSWDIDDRRHWYIQLVNGEGWTTTVWRVVTKALGRGEALPREFSNDPADIALREIEEHRLRYWNMF